MLCDGCGCTLQVLSLSEAAPATVTTRGKTFLPHVTAIPAGSTLAALAAGGIIGLERTYHGRPAGFRTHTLVCMASHGRGRLEEVTRFDAATLDRLRSLALYPWADGRRDHWLRLVPSRLTGRRIRPHAAPQASG